MSVCADLCGWHVCAYMYVYVLRMDVYVYAYWEYKLSSSLASVVLPGSPLLADKGT